MTAAATRDDLAAVVFGLRSEVKRQLSEAERLRALGFATLSSHATGMAAAYEVSADMISKYVSVEPGYTRVVNGVTG